MNETSENLPEALTTSPESKPTEGQPVVVPGLEQNENGDLVEDIALALESDGDVFWLIQRVLWGILKLVSVLGVIVGVIWLIWGEMPHKKGETKQKVSVEKITEKVAPKKEVKRRENRKETEEGHKKNS